MVNNVKMRIAVDAMGGDYAPQAIVAGAVQAAQESNVEIILVGLPAVLERELGQYNTRGLKIEIATATDVIGFDEQPALAVKSRKGLSMRVMCDLVAAGRADACVTMGHSGAALVAGMLTFGRIEGITRPAVGVWLMGLQPNTFLIDIAMNVDSKPEYLLQYAVMGSVYVERMHGVARPRVALLSNGAEDNKGNALIHEAFPLLKASGLNFVGNIEGFDIPTGKADVIVMDGFTGNIVLKYTEGLATWMLRLADEALAQRLTGDALAAAREAMADLALKSDYAETGAMPLLGVNKLIFIGHGRSNAKATRNAIAAAARAAEADLVGAIRTGVQALASHGSG